MPPIGPPHRTGRKPRRKPVRSAPRTEHIEVKQPAAPRPASPRRVARAQERAYVSQGKAVQKAAGEQRRSARTRQAQAKDTKGDAEFARATTYKRTPQYLHAVEQARVAGFKASPAYKDAKGRLGYISSLLHIANSPTAKLRQAHRDAIGALMGGGPDIPRTGAELARTLQTGQAAMRGKHGATIIGGGVAAGPAAPSLFALHQVIRPSHAIMSGAHAALSGKGAGASLGAASQGFLHADKAATGSDVVGDLGVKNKALRSVLGFVGDVALDPTTYATFGTSVPAKLAAERAAEAAATAARDVSRHLGPREALAAESSAYKHAYETTYAEHAAKGRGVQAGARFHVPLTTITKELRTPAIGSKLAAGRRADVAEKVRSSRPGGATVRAVGAFNPDVRPPGVAQADWNVIRHAGRVYRGKLSTAERDVMNKAHGFAATNPSHDWRSFIHGIETEGPLTKGQTHFVDRLNEMAARERSRGLLEGDRNRGPAPHVPPVTADVESAQRAVRHAAQERVAAEKMHHNSLAGFGVARGRAQVLSRNVGGTVAERRAQAATVAHGTQFAGGAHGVEHAAAGLRASASRVAETRAAQKLAEQNLEEVKTLARAQRTANRQASGRLKDWQSTAARYFPHKLETELNPPKATETVTGHGVSVPKLASSKGRSVTQPIHMQARENTPSLNLPAVFAKRGLDSAKAVERSDFMSQVAGLGRELKGDTVLQPHEMVYRVDKHGLQPLRLAGDGNVSRRKLQAALRKAGQETSDTDRFVVLPGTLQRQWEAQISRGAPSDNPWLAKIDKVTGEIKKFQTIYSPAYQGTNLAGDTFMFRQGGGITQDMVSAGKVAKAAIALHGFVRGGDDIRGAHQVLSATIRIRGKDVPAKDILRRFEAQGLGEGGHNRELNQLTGKPSESRLRRFNTAREALPRYASFISALRRGMTDKQAAAHVVQHHFDYSDLTAAERGTRRVIPFYTFAARNTKLQAKKLATSPGRLATYEKAREETAKGAGVDLQKWEQALAEYQRRGAPLALPGGLILYPRMPLTDLNQFTLSGHETLKNVTDRTAPVVKVPFEVAANRDFYFNEPINPNDPRTERVQAGAKGLVPAPNMLGIGTTLEKLGIAHPIESSRQGQGKVPGWNPLIPFLLHTIPQTNYSQQLLTNSGDANRGVNSGLAVANILTGVKVAKQNPAKDAYGHAIQSMALLQAEKNDALQRGQTKKAASISHEMSRLRKKLPALRKAAGYKVTPRKSRRSSGSSSGGFYAPSTAPSSNFYAPSSGSSSGFYAP